MKFKEFKITESQVLKESGTTRLTVGNKTYEVGNDLIKQGGVYAIFSGDSARRYAQSNGLVVPPREVLQAVYAQGRQLEMPTRPNNPTDTNAQAHHEQIIEKNGNIPSGLVYGHKKEICEGSGTRLFGGIVDGRQLQSGTRSQHGGGYVDYSQGLRTCKLVEGDRTGNRGVGPRSSADVPVTPTVSTRGTSQSDEYITSGPPYPPEHYGVVRALQYALDTLGYSVGETGYDGKFGPRTTRALRSFKRDYNVPGPASAFGLPTIRKFEQIAAGQVARVETPTPTGNQPTARYGSGGRATTSDDPNFQAPGYPTSMTRSRIEDIIAVEAEQRGIDPDVAVRIFRHEGAGSYQSSVPRRGRGSLGGREASFGPYQLYIGGGLGNEYQRETGRDLTTDNTEEGITNQIRFALDMAVRDSWQPWYGRGPAGVGRRQGLEGAREVGNWS